MNDRFHRAAKDGYKEVLKQANKKDLNQKDEGGMTPTLWAAYHGNLDALTLCCSRGGDPDKCDYSGNTALHFVCANGHLNCLKFLVKFGANIWQMDNDCHTIMDVAAIRQQNECIRFLDITIEKQKSLDKKKVESLQARAKKDAEKRVKEYEKMQQEQQKKNERERKKDKSKGSVSSASTKYKKNSMTNGTVQSVIGAKNKAQRQLSSSNTGFGGFTISQNGRQTMNSLSGIQSQSQGDVLFQSSETISESSYQQQAKRKTLGGVFPIYGDKQTAEKGNIFGTMALRNNFSGGFGFASERLHSDEFSKPTVGGNFNGTGIGSSLTSMPKDDDDDLYDWQSSSDNQYHSNVDGDGDIDDFMKNIEEPSEVETFLAGVGLSEYSKLFAEQKMDMEVLMTCTEDDLRDLEIVKGHRMKILRAIKERQEAMEDPNIELTEF